MDPLFPDDEWQKYADKGHLVPNQKGKVEPADSAVNLIRSKIEFLYAREPDVRQELAEAGLAGSKRSKHQEFMHRLSTSGQSLAEIQTAWHDYYARLTDREKHEVWQEFYDANSKHASTKGRPGAERIVRPEGHRTVPIATRRLGKLAPGQTAVPHSIKKIKQKLLERVASSRIDKAKAKQHLHSLMFGLIMGGLALMIALFGLFNQVVITPFIKPGSGPENTPIILSTDALAPSDTAEVIIPKINAQLPVRYDVQSLVETDIQKALEDGVFHYPSTAQPGNKGNIAIFGHSSNNIFNKGKYKFAFVLLRELEPGDIFYLTYEKKVYTYKVYDKKIVNPEDTWVLGTVDGKTATATLITCDPPGTSRHRLVVWGEQVNPDPNGNSAPAEPSPALEEQGLPGNGPGPLTRFWRWIF